MKKEKGNEEVCTHFSTLTLIPQSHTLSQSIIGRVALNVQSSPFPSSACSSL